MQSLPSWSTPPKVTVSTKNLVEHIEITVSDNGPGIPDDIKDKIFQPFFTTKPVGKGTGLGLMICKEFIERNGGKIWLESTPGKGSRFTLSIPFGKP